MLSVAGILGAGSPELFEALDERPQESITHLIFQSKIEINGSLDVNNPNLLCNRSSDVNNPSILWYSSSKITQKLGLRSFKVKAKVQ